MNKNFNIPILILSALILNGCSSEENARETSINSSDEPIIISESISDKSESLDKNSEEFKELLNEYSSEISIEGLGTIIPTGFGYNDELGIDGTDKDLIPYNYVDEEFSENIDLYIESVSLAKMDLDENGMAFFNQSGPLQMAMVNMHITNKSDLEAIYLPSMMKLVVSDKEIFSEPSMTEDNNSLENPIAPGKTVSGVAVFVFDDTLMPKTISLDASQFFVATPQGEEELINFEILDIEHSIIKDNYWFNTQPFEAFLFNHKRT